MSVAILGPTSRLGNECEPQHQQSFSDCWAVPLTLGGSVIGGVLYIGRIIFSFWVSKRQFQLL